MLDDFDDYDHRLNAVGTPGSSTTVPSTQRNRGQSLQSPLVPAGRPSVRPTNLINYASTFTRARPSLLPRLCALR